MKHAHSIVLAAALALTGCQHYVQSEVVLPPESGVASVEIVSGPQRSSLDKRKIESLMSFLRDECRWTQSKPEILYGNDYAVVIHLGDGRAEVVEVGDRELVLDGYRCHLSKRAADRLDELCGMGRVVLSPFQAKGR